MGNRVPARVIRAIELAKAGLTLITDAPVDLSGIWQDLDWAVPLGVVRLSIRLVGLDGRIIVVCDDLPLHSNASYCVIVWEHEGLSWRWGFDFRQEGNRLIRISPEEPAPNSTTAPAP